MNCEHFFDVKQIKPQLELTADLITRYFQNLPKYPVDPGVKPGFIKEYIPTEMPVEPEKFENILEDFEKISSKMLHWNHPGFFGYFTAQIHHSVIAAEAICAAFGSPNFNWNVSQTSHDVELLVVEWLRKMLGLAEKFKFENGGVGGITNSVTETGFMSVNLAKFQKIKELDLGPYDERRLKFVAYYPETNISWAKKILLMKDITTQRCLKVHLNEDGDYRIKVEELVQQINEDIEDGFIPFWYGSNLGSTDCLVMDDYDIIGSILKDYKIYFYVDAPYYGMLLSCGEYRVKGLE